MPPLSERRPPAQDARELSLRFVSDSDIERLLETDRIEIIAGSGNKDLSRRIASLLGKVAGEPSGLFADKENQIMPVRGNLRKKDVFIVQCMHPDPDQKFVELQLMIDAAKKASAEDIAVVLLYEAYMRQDKKDQSRVPISAAILPKFFEDKGVNRVLSMELHSDQQQGFFDGPWDIVPSSFVTAQAVVDLGLSNPIVASPDAGGLSRARRFSRIIGLGDNVIEGDKERQAQEKNQSTLHGYNGEVAGYDVVLLDDMLDTGGTILDIADRLHDGGASSITAVIAYGLFSDKDGVSSIKRINESPIDKVLVTNAIEPKREALESPKFQYIDVAPTIAEAILCVHTGESISQRLILDPPKS